MYVERHENRIIITKQEGSGTPPIHEARNYMTYPTDGIRTLYTPSRDKHLECITYGDEVYITGRSDCGGRSDRFRLSNTGRTVIRFSDERPGRVTIYNFND